MSSRVCLRLSGAFALAATALSCSSGPETQPAAESPPPEPAPRSAIEEARERIAERLRGSEAGCVLLRACEAQGGLDAWLRTEALRARIEREYEEPSRDSAPPGPRREIVEFAWERARAARAENGSASLESAGGGGDGEGGAIESAAARYAHGTGPERSPSFGALELGAPFPLASGDLEAESLGIEADARTVEKFHRVRYRRAGSEPFFAIASFDTASGYLRRLLVPAGGEGFRLFVFSGWREWAGTPLKLPERHDVYRMRRLYAHFHRKPPYYKARILELRAVPAAPPGS